jgi:hypothetical protein
MMSVSYCWGYARNGQREEMWHVVKDGVHHAACITFDLAWFRREGSINDLKRMAIGTVS